MKDDRMKNALENIARHGVPENINLMPQIAAKLKRKSPMTTLRTRPFVAILIALFILLTLSGVAYALGRALGYIPGVGFVQTNSLRTLAEPVSQTRDGITVSIEQVFVDSERTIIIYKAEGLTIAAANSKGEGGVNPFGAAQLLRLPDGSMLAEYTDYRGTPEPLLNNIKTEGGWPNYVARLVFPPLSSDVDKLTLIIPILQNMPADAAPENWEITFQLKPAPADMTYAPVIEFAPATESVITSTPAAGEAGTPLPANISTVNGFTLQLDNVIELEDGYVFTGNLSGSNFVPPTGQEMITEAAIPVLTDSSGQVIPMEQVPLDGSNQGNKMSWSYHTNRKDFTVPLTLSVASIKTSSIASAGEFEIDLGTTPQVGQTWEINQDFVLGGRTIHLLSAQLNGDCGTQMYALIFNFVSDLAGDYAFVSDNAPQVPFDYSCEGGGGMWEEGRPVDSKTFSTAVRYGTIPFGLHQYSIVGETSQVINGPWQVTWTPPLTSEPTQAPAAGACLTLEKWNQLSARNDPLPTGVGGKIITTHDEGGSLPALYISNLDGTNPLKIDDEASWPSLSTDRTRLTYSANDGFHVVNLSTGENSTFGMDFGADGYIFILSPDNMRMLVYTISSTLNVINADGSGTQKIDTGSSQVISPLGWLDNQTIIYAVMGGDGFTFTTHNLQSGETKKLFTFQNKAGFGAISPDRKWISFTDKIFGANNWSNFISRLDGSDRRQITATDVPIGFSSVWSPDGQWLIISTITNDGTYVPILINPFTCETVRLNIHDTVKGWIP